MRYNEDISFHRFVNNLAGVLFFISFLSLRLICLNVRMFSRTNDASHRARSFSCESQSWGILRTSWTREGTTTTTQMTTRLMKTKKKKLKSSSWIGGARRLWLFGVRNLPEDRLSVISRKFLMVHKNMMNTMDQTCCWWCCWVSSASQGTTVMLDSWLRLLLDSE